MQYSYIKGVWMVPKGKKIICSFWVSDLLRTADNLNHFMVGKALQRANIITVQSTELREIVLAKYGRELKAKIRLTQFALSMETFDLIDGLRGNRQNVEAFCKKNKIGFDKIKIVVGHNASDYNNHLPLIEALAKLPSKEMFFLVVPFAYGIAPGARDEYRKKIVDALDASLMPYVILDEYLSGRELASLRLATDIFLHMPESDALSAALTETAYAGSVIITGGWLPYSPFKKAGMRLLYCDTRSDVTTTVADILQDFDGAKQLMAHENILAVKNNFFPAVTTEGWLKIFDELTPQ